MLRSYVYPGTQSDFYEDYGGLPGKQLGSLNIFIIFIIIIIVIVVITAIAFALNKTKTVFTDHTDFYNLDTLIDANNADYQCCVFPGTTAANQEYIYDVVNNITYARQRPLNVSTVCSSFPDPNLCQTQNTDSSGVIIPRVTFASKPYYTFEYGLFVGCESSIVC